MKKIFFWTLALILSFILINTSNANNTENLLYKNTAISKAQIEKDYPNGKSLNKKIENMFVKYRYLKDKQTLNKLEVTLKKEIIKLNSKSYLWRNDRKKLNLFNNLYYRTKLLLNYNLK